MDKNTITGLVLIAILLVGFSFLSRPSKEQLEAQQRYYDSSALVQQREEALKAKADAALANEKDVETVDSTSLFYVRMLPEQIAGNNQHKRKRHQLPYQDESFLY